MAKQFEVGKLYYRCDNGYDPVRVTRRTEKTIWVTDEHTNRSWMMRVRRFDDGTEWAVEYQVPKEWRDVARFDARFVEQE